MSTDVISFVVHPDHLDKLNLQPQANLQMLETCGPLGFNRYTAFRDQLDISMVREFNAVPFYLSLPEEVIRYYNENYFLEMFKVILNIRLGAKPDSFQVLRFEELNKRYYYPQYTGQYLYINLAETRLLNINSLALLGYYPVSANPEVWNVYKVTNPLSFEGACVIKTQKLTFVEYENIRSTEAELDYLKLGTPVK